MNYTMRKRNEVMNFITNLFLIMCAVIIIPGFTYGLYWVGKTFSYSFFYEDMVERSIYKTVKPSCIK